MMHEKGELNPDIDTIQIRGRNHVMEAVSLLSKLDLNKRADYDFHLRLGRFLQESGFAASFPIRNIPGEPMGWHETLWDRRSSSYEEIIPAEEIKKADTEILRAELSDPDSIEHAVGLASAEIRLKRIVGKSVDDRDFETAESAVDRVRTISDRLSDHSALIEALAYTGVAMIKNS